MGSAVERLTALVDAEDRYDIPLADLRPTQVEAANERLNSRLGSIRLLAHRADTAGIKKISEPADLVPLLFAHSSYKGYPENWLVESRWDRLGKWLDTVSSYRVTGVNTDDIRDIDDWLDRLAAKGHFLSCSSGTTGKISMINAAMGDRLTVKRICARSFQWATGMKPEGDRNLVILNPAGNNFRNLDTTDALKEVYSKSEFRFGTHITIGQISRMVRLRRNIAEGTALPADIASFEATSADRQRSLDEAVVQAAERLVEKRAEKVLIVGQFPLTFRVAETVRAMGHGGKEFHPDNALVVGGGLKGSVLPPDYREYIFDTLNIRPSSVYHMYAMQEINTHFPRCQAGRYHVAPWLLFLLLDANGEQLLEPVNGEMEGRAGFFDLSQDGRWGGLISGDRVRVDYRKCACGHQGPTIDSDIVRYKDLPGGDNITCAGTIDAYVRGAAA